MIQRRESELIAQDQRNQAKQRQAQANPKPQAQAKRKATSTPDVAANTSYNK